MLYADEAARDVWGQAYYSGTPDHTRALLSCWTVPTEHWLKYKGIKQHRAVLSMEPHGAAQVGNAHVSSPALKFLTNEESVSKEVCKGSGNWLVFLFLLFIWPKAASDIWEVAE